MKFIAHRKFQGVVTCRHQVAITLGRLTICFAWLSEYYGPLKWFSFSPNSATCARWSRCFWIHRAGVGLGIDFIGMDRLH